MSDKEINILLLGETGVGKSTFINTFANYLSYETLEEALNGQTVCLIPTQFVVTDFEDFETHFVKYGESENECFEEKGQSSTQSCRAYTFNYGKCAIRLIDTPGVGDTRGTEQDNKNFENILSFIANYNELHLICILLKPDLQRLTTNFMYCLKQLLFHLHKDASNNIVFIFTDTRQTSYRPKNTLVLLREVLNKFKTNPPFVEIPVQKKTMYCLDNDSIQYLIAVRKGFKFDDKEREKFTQNWTQSVKEWERLINYIFDGKDGHPLQPYTVQNMLFIKEIRHLIITLRQPIEEITKTLVKEVLPNIDNIIREIENCGENNEELIKLIESNKYEFMLFWWDYIPIVGSITVPIKYGRRLYSKNKIKELKEQLNNETKRLEIKNQLLKEWKDLKEEYLMEKQTIIEASAKFAIFLKNNAITTYIDSNKEYIQAQIQNLKTTPHNEEDQQNIKDSIEGLENALNEYEREKENVENNIESVDEEESPISFENINKLIQQLYGLKFSGKQIKRLHKQNKTIRNDQAKKEEQLFDLGNLSSSIADGIKNLFSLQKFF